MISPRLGQSASASAELFVDLPSNLPTSLEKLDLQMQAELEAAWDDMSQKAREAACERLKQEFPNDQAVQEMDCSSTSLRNVARVAGYTAGVYLCTSTGVGAAAAQWGCGPMGAWLADTFYDEIKEMNLRFGTTGTITGGWADMSLWQRFNWCYRTEPLVLEDGTVINYPGERNWYIDRYGNEAYQSRCQQAFPGYVPEYYVTPTHGRRPSGHEAIAQEIKRQQAEANRWYRKPAIWLSLLAAGATVGGAVVFKKRRRRR